MLPGIFDTNHVVDVPAVPAQEARAIVGGADHAVGGWGAYEIARREAEWKHGGGAGVQRPGERYAGRTYIHGLDAAQSVLTGSRRTVGGAGGAGHTESALQQAALRLADALGVLEDRLCEPDEDGVWECVGPDGTEGKLLIVPAVTSADLRAFAEDPAQEADPESLYELDESVAKAVAMIGKESGMPNPPRISLRPDLPPLPTHAVPVDDDEAVLRLEAEVEPYVESLEQEQAAVATRLEAAAEAISRWATARVPKGLHVQHGGAPKPQTLKGRLTRGEEIDAAAAKPPPAAILRGGILPPDAETREFDLVGDPPKLVETQDGLYCGFSTVGNPARITALFPTMIRRASLQTSGRIYAWYIMDSPEACYAVRAAPVKGRLRDIDIDDLTHWLQAHLTGTPPHKIEMKTWLKHLRGLGLEIHVGAKRSSEIRFNLESSVSKEDRVKAIQRLTLLTEPDFSEFDWSGYDKVAGLEPCRSPLVETAGDVHIDLSAKTIRAVKIRTGIPYASQSHERSYVTFHTHPVGRYRGREAEPPSTADLRNSLRRCVHEVQAWHFVSAPEGTYIYRPSALLKKLYLRDPETVREMIPAMYVESLTSIKEVGSTLVSASAIPAILAEIGFIAYFRGAPCVPMLDVPDMWSWTNSRSRESLREDYRRALYLAGEQILRADWGPVNALFAVSALQHESRVSWASVRAIAAQSTPDLWMESEGEGHEFDGEITDPEAWNLGKFWPGPILVLHFGGAVPRRVPRAAIAAAHNNSSRWAWVVFLSADEILAFRATEADLEVHGPKKLTKLATKKNPKISV